VLDLVHPIRPRQRLGSAGRWPRLDFFFLRVRRETGKKSVVKVHHGEGVAIHIDPESCADAREGIGEALTGERIGQAIEP
jgi:hypothetical protein